MDLPSYEESLQLQPRYLNQQPMHAKSSNYLATSPPPAWSSLNIRTNAVPSTIVEIPSLTDRDLDLDRDCNRNHLPSECAAQADHLTTDATIHNNEDPPSTESHGYDLGIDQDHADHSISNDSSDSNSQDQNHLTQPAIYQILRRSSMNNRIERELTIDLETT